VSGTVLVEAQRRFVSVMEKGSLERFRLSLEREPEECSTTSRVRPRGTYDDLTEYSSQHRNTAADGSIKSFFRVSRGNSTGQTVSREVPLAPERAGEVRTLLRLKEDPSPLGNRGFSGGEKTMSWSYSVLLCSLYCYCYCYCKRIPYL